MRWCAAALPRRAPTNEYVDPLNGQTYRHGEFVPFYVPRPIMPQVDAEDYPALEAFITARNVPFETITIQPQACFPHQRVDHFKAASMPPEVAAKPILLSADRFVLDGNHRWWFHRLHHMPLRAYRIGLSFEPAIGLLFDFPKTYSLDTHPQTN